jgi:hypothetical protein
LFEQNNKSNCRKLTISIVIGKAKVMSYEDIIKAQAKQDAKDALHVPVKGKRGRKRKNPVPVVAAVKRTWRTEVEVAKDEIEVMGQGSYCTVLQF